jgi:dipeptidyl aminopeptidase/acylaminoacyl peptidase
MASAAPLEAYSALPKLDNVTISPDGSKFVYAVEYQGKQAVVAATADASPKILSQMPASDQKVRSLLWADPDHVVIIKGQQSQFGEQQVGYVMELSTHKIDPLLKPPSSDNGAARQGVTTMNVVTGQIQTRTVDGKATLFVPGVAFEGTSGTTALIKVDVQKNAQSLVDRALSPQEARSWVLDPQGRLVAEGTYHQDTRHWSIRLKRADGWSEAYDVAVDQMPPSVQGLSADGSALLLSTPSDKGPAPQLLTFADGRMAPAAYGDIYQFLVDPVTQKVYGGVKTGAEEDYRFFDKADQAAWDKILAAFPGEEVELATWSDDRKKVVVKITGQGHGVAYMLVDLAANKAISLGSAYPAIGPADVAGIETVTYKAADGQPVPAYLTLPNGRDAKNLPLVVLPHGGPAGRDGLGFDWLAQALASRGYAVLQPQFRGSEGFGWDWQAAGFGELGRKMQSDLSDGVRALARSGMIDPKRVCIVGSSYGGYAALAGVTLETGVYRCAVSIGGIADLKKSGNAFDPSRRYWDKYLGVKDETDASLDQFSPVRHADRTSAPVLLIHGSDDVVVPIDQSRRMADAIKAAGKSVQFVTLKSNDHGLADPDTRQQVLQETVKFLEANNPPS